MSNRETTPLNYLVNFMDEQVPYTLISESISAEFNVVESSGRRHPDYGRMLGDSFKTAMQLDATE